MHQQVFKYNKLWAEALWEKLGKLDWGHFESATANSYSKTRLCGLQSIILVVSSAVAKLRLCYCVQLSRFMGFTMTSTGIKWTWHLAEFITYGVQVGLQFQMDELPDTLCIEKDLPLPQDLFCHSKMNSKSFLPLSLPQGTLPWERSTSCSVEKVKEMHDYQIAFKTTRCP